MPCYHPVYLHSGQVACGHCVHCRLNKAYEWAVRCQHEASLYTENCFITLTYDDKRLPKGYDLREGLIYSHFQIDFLKAFRERCGGRDAVTHHNYGKINKKTGEPYPQFHRPIRFYMSGEYGEVCQVCELSRKFCKCVKFKMRPGRPHWHACIFNFDFSDKYYWRMSDDGYPVYRSPTLEELWPYGNSELGSVTFKSAGYCARYIMKKQNGEKQEKHYRLVDSATGRVFDRRPEFSKQSLKPGIGEGWFKKYWSDVFPHDHVVIGGAPRKVPRYYDKKYAQMTAELLPVCPFYDPETGELFEKEVSPIMDNIKHDRMLEALKNVDDNTPERLRVKEQVHLAKLSRLKRNLS